MQEKKGQKGEEERTKKNTNHDSFLFKVFMDSGKRTVGKLYRKLTPSASRITGCDYHYITGN